MTLGRTSSGALKIKTDEAGGGLRAVNCGCCGGGCDPCYTDLTPYPSLLGTLDNATSVAINTGSTLSSFAKTADGGFEASFAGPNTSGNQCIIAGAFFNYVKPCKQIRMGVVYDTFDFIYHYTHETCSYPNAQNGEIIAGWDQAPFSPAVVNGVSFPMLAYFDTMFCGMPSSISIVFTVS